MRLIRLVSENQNGIFENTFNTDIEVKSTEKIALQSCSFSERTNVVEIDETNGEVVFTYQAGRSLTVDLENAVYDDTNKEDLLEDITNKLCNAVPFQGGRELGMEYECAENNSKNINIGFQRSDYTTVGNRLAANPPQVELVNAEQAEVPSTSIHKADGQPASTDDSSKYVSLVNFGQGCKVYRTQLSYYQDNGGGATLNNGLRFGVSPESPDVWKNKATMSTDELGYYIQFERDTRTYKYQAPGIGLTDSGVMPEAVNGVPTNNDILEIVLAQNQVIMNVYRSSDAGASLLTTRTITQGTKLYPYITFQGPKPGSADGGIEAFQPAHHRDCFVSGFDPILTGPHGDDEFPTQNPPPAIQLFRAPTRYEASLVMSEALSSFLGYNNSQQPPQGADPVRGRDRVFFEAQQNFTASLSHASYIIELRNIQIDSYNAVSGERENILAIVPQNSDNNQQIVEYQPSVLYPIDVRQDALLRHIQARIKRIDGSTPLLDGLSVITLLLI